MTLRPLNVSFSIRWSSNDTWSEAYVGVRRLVYDILPPSHAEQQLEDSAFCQLALIGANHLVEVALGQLLRPFTARGVEGLTPEALEKATYFQMLTQWVPMVTGKRVDTNSQPFRSAEALRKRRNDTVHKSSALASVPMARAALFSAVQACQAIYQHAGESFPYSAVLSEHPLMHADWFSDVRMPPAI